MFGFKAHSLRVLTLRGVPSAGLANQRWETHVADDDSTELTTVVDDQEHGDTYAEAWADAINETYEVYESEHSLIGELHDGETIRDAERRILKKAADCLRNGVPATFTGVELDLVRHLMPAHEVHRSGAVRWGLNVYGDGSAVAPT
jgi:hypothetical protein